MSPRPVHLPSSVLVTTVGAATGLCVLRALRRGLGDDVRLIGTDIQPSERVPGAVFADEFHQVPPAFDDGYGDALITLVERSGVEFVIPIFDGEVLQVARLRDRLAAAGAACFVAPSDVIETCNSKIACAGALAAAGIPTPPTVAARDADQKALTYPVIVKPDDGVGSKSTFVARDAAEFGVFRDRTPKAVVQPMVAGDEFTVELLADPSGSVVAHVARQRLETKEGVATKSLTVDRPDLVKVAGEVVRALGLVGASNIQLIGRPGDYQVIDVNPRFAAGQPLGLEAGVNLPVLLLRLAAGEKLPPGEHAAEPGIVMLRYYEATFVRESRGCP